MPLMRKQGDEECVQDQVGGECRNLEVVYFVVAGQGLEKREEGEKGAARAAFLPQQCPDSSSQAKGGAVLGENDAARGGPRSNLACALPSRGRPAPQKHL